MDVFRIELPEDLSHEDVTQLVQELHEVDEVVETSSDTRSLTGALVLVKVVGGVAVKTANRARPLPLLAPGRARRPMPRKTPAGKEPP